MVRADAMDKLIINVPGAPAREVALKPGLNRFGRSLNTDIQIAHPSVSSLHCDITGRDGDWTVKDLGSTNGITLDGQPIKEGALQRGQTLQLGEVEVVFAEEGGVARKPVASFGTAIPVELPVPPPVPGVRRVELPLPPPLPGAVATPTAKAPPKAKKSARAPEGFYATIPAAFVFPFRRNGLILLGSGAVFFVLLNFLTGMAGIVGIGLGLFCVGYLFSFLKSIIAATAIGEDEMPAWPDYEGWVQSGFLPFLEMFGLLLCCLGPFLLYSRMADAPETWIEIVLLAGGLVYLPMALLALGIYDNILAINPMVVAVSIARAPLAYLAACGVLGLLAASVAAADYWIRRNANVPILASVVDEFLSLYTLSVMARLMGQFYHTKKDALKWKLGGG